MPSSSTHLNLSKSYSHPYLGILCTKNKYAISRLERLEFIAGKTYPFTCVSFETTGAINAHRPTQVIAEDGYKVLFSGEDIIEFFDISQVKVIFPKSTL
ncbi:MAG: hypothetical protein ACRC1P_02060 [Cellulosilyticaceae bacterium]